VQGKHSTIWFHKNRDDEPPPWLDDDLDDIQKRSSWSTRPTTRSMT
jgi:hypothetical protein